MAESDPFLSAEKLGITEEQKCALVKVMVALGDGTITEQEFYMPVWKERGYLVGDRSRHHCKTVACIGGWAETLGKVNMRHTGGGQGMDDLFHPPGVEWRAIGAVEAIRAIQNYLRTGDPDWRGAMKR
jgi:hypothetical protein